MNRATRRWLTAFAMVAALASSGLAVGQRAFVLGATTTTGVDGNRSKAGSAKDKFVGERV